MSELFTFAHFIDLATLSGLEFVLGIDNIVVIGIVEHETNRK